VEKSHLPSNGRPVKWYDYLACFYCADLISAGLVHFNVVALLLGAVTYAFYEDFRKTVPR